jgi:CYTH domain-containing protein
MLEIERRFLLPASHQPRGESVAIWQGYLVIEPSISIRIREVEHPGGIDRWLTVKSLPSPDVALVRHETELAITADQFGRLREAVRYAPIVKDRFSEPLANQLVLEVDVFAGDLAGLLIAEIEFTSVETAGAFAPPAWLGREITEDQRYLNTHLARYGLPADQR